MPAANGRVHDIVGVGFGPANLALSIVVDEYGREHPGGGCDAVFLERQDRFGWHRGMLIDGATMQVCFLKDLVSLRRPTSDFSFLSYLFDQGRLVDFINHKSFYPTRVEFHDYLEWAAARMAGCVEYGVDVTEIQPVAEDGRIRAFDVVGFRTAEPTVPIVRRARNVVVATGLRPRLPEGVRLGPRVWHNRDLLFNLEGPIPATARRFVVVGAGQSAAETVEYLHRAHPEAEVYAVFGRYGYSPADDSPFANRIFDPEAVDVFHGADEHTRARLMRYHANTNYGVVDLDLIEELYRRVYQEKVLGRSRLTLCNVSSVRDVVESEDHVMMSIVDHASGDRRRLTADVIIYATGYDDGDHAELLGKLEPYLIRRDGRYVVDRDHRVRARPTLEAGVYLQGGTEHTHGISSSLLSTVAVRSGEILDSVLVRQDRRIGRVA